MVTTRDLVKSKDATVVPAVSDGQGHRPCDAHRWGALPDTREEDGHHEPDAQQSCAVSSPSHANAGGHLVRDIQSAAAPVLDSPEGEFGKEGRTPADARVGGAPFPELAFWVKTYMDVQQQRMATYNRRRCLIRDSVPREQWGGIDFADKQLSDKKIYPFLPPEAKTLVATLLENERLALRQMRREVRKHPLWPWLKTVRGISEIFAARILVQIEPYRFLNVGKLWSYCGMDGPDWKRRLPSGKLTYSKPCHSLAQQIGKSLMKCQDGQSIYRDVYTDRRVYELDRLWCGKCHNKDDEGGRATCTAGHQDAKATRYVAKAFLKDLWVVAHKE